MEAGKELFNQFKESMLNEQAKAAAEKESKIIAGLMADVTDHRGNFIRKGLTYEEAKAWVITNYEIERKRLEKRQSKLGR
jgi:predicted neuraminidase